MALVVQQARFRPPTMPKAGGSVTFVFDARSTGGATSQKTKYSIPSEFPYEFDNATDPADSRVVSGEADAVTEDPRDHEQVLILRKVDGADTRNVFVKAEVFEVDSTGNPLIDSGQPVQPKVLRGVITLK